MSKRLVFIKIHKINIDSIRKRDRIIITISLSVKNGVEEIEWTIKRIMIFQETIIERNKKAEIDNEEEKNYRGYNHQ